MVVYWVSVALLVWQSLQLNQGYLAYPLDDPYIHMAMAKNVALHGVWGVTRYEFSSTSSSPLWTALLAAVYRMFGVGTAAPLWLNVVSGSIAIWIANGMFRRNNCGAWWTFAGLVALIAGSALPTLTITGMEHTLHGLLTLAFVASAVAVIDGTRVTRSGRVLALLAAALASTRYEGLFAIAVVAVALVVTGRLALAVLTVAAGMAPVLLYGAWSMSHGWYFLPNSVLLKGNVPDASAYGIAKVLIGWNALNALQQTPHLLVLLAAALVLALRTAAVTTTATALTGIFVGATLLHLQFAKTGWFFRYEAYLLMLGLVVVGSAAGSWVQDLRARAVGAPGWLRLAVATLLIAIVGAPIAVRSVRAFLSTPAFTKITYDQQVQMGRFLADTYSGRTIVVNDIGAVNFFADIEIVDLVGLASMDVARLRRRGEPGPWIEPLVGKRADIAIVYDSWLKENGGVTEAWQKAGEWSGAVPNSTVAFYAIGTEHVEQLHANLKAFTASLPPDVVASGAFLR